MILDNILIPFFCCLNKCVVVIYISVYSQVNFTVADIGSTNATISGKPCQRWDSQSPHIHPYSNLSAFENYCMNPNEDAALWCYTTDNRHKTEFCLRTFAGCELFHFLVFVIPQN